MRIAGVMHESIVDGPGVRFVVFAQGCLHRCQGCHNPETWDPMGGQEIPVRAIFREIRRAPDSVKGLTLSGGEPFLQPAEMGELAARAHEIGLSVMTYTGYVLEDLVEMANANPDIARLLNETDILVDGPFVETLRGIQLRFRGSENQRVYDLKASREQGVLVELGEEGT